MGSLNTAVVAAIFVASAAAVWIAGVQVSKTTDILAKRLGLGDALGGLVVLAIVTNLPEIAIVVSGAVRGDLSLAVGDILGGIAAQTVVLALLDRFGTPTGDPLSRRASSLMLVLECNLVLLVLGLVVAGTQMPERLKWFRLTPVSVAITLAWCGGVWLTAKVGKELPWSAASDAAPTPAPASVAASAAGNPASPPRQHHDHLPLPVHVRHRRRAARAKEADEKGWSTGRVAAIFGAGALVTLIAGVLLETTSDALASRWHIGGAVFGATVLAGATSLPELSTGITSVRLGDIEMAAGDIFGGNAFLPALFMVATLLSGQAVLPHAGSVNIYLTAVGIVLTTVYVAGFIIRPTRRVLGMGIDSFVVLVLYVASVALLPTL